MDYVRTGEGDMLIDTTPKQCQPPAPDSCTSAEVTALKSEIEALKAQIADLIATNKMLVQMMSQKGDGAAACTQDDAIGR